MNFQELSNSEELSEIKQRYVAEGIDFEPVLKEAEKAFNSSMSFAAPSRTEIISYLLNFLQTELEKKLSKPAKTKAGKIVRLFWSAAKFLGLVGKAKQAVLKEAGRL